MKSMTVSLSLLAAVACCIAADGPIKADTSMAALDLDPTPHRDLLVLGIHEAKKGAAEQVKANSNQGTAKGDKAAAKAMMHANRAGAPVTGVTMPDRRLNEEQAARTQAHGTVSWSLVPNDPMAQSHAKRAGLVAPPTSPGRQLLGAQEDQWWCRCRCG